jgi:type I restriction enzyme M protein
MLGDGSTHVYKADSIRPNHWSAALKAIIHDGSFSVVVTNPPFGTKLKVKPEVGREEKYTLSVDWKRTTGGWVPTTKYVERDLGLIFLERCIRLLEDDGRLAIVLPDTYLFSDSYGWLVQWLSRYTITYSINVPIEAFEPYCRAKTSVLVLKKSSPPKGHQVIGSVCETFGEDKHGRLRYKFVAGVQTSDRDDEMSEAASLFRANPMTESKLFFRFSQADAAARGVLVASYWWRAPYVAALEEFAKANDCRLLSVGDLLAMGELTVMDGHGSPSPHFHGRGPIPYVKVTDIKNWRIIENPSYSIPQTVADKFRRGKFLEPLDIVTPTRASKNIGLFAMVLPWQARVILTREITIWRVSKDAKVISPYLLLALMSLRVVHDQFRFLVLMQMNREDLGARFREILLPIPNNPDKRAEWSDPIQRYFGAMTAARDSYDELAKQLDPDLFADRP